MLTEFTRYETAFRVAASELGFTSAAWLFAREVGTHSGDAGVERLRDELGRTYPVLDAVARAWLAGARGPTLRVEAVLELCRGATHVLVTGIEATFLDALALAPARIGLVTSGVFEADWDRVLSNHGGRVEGVGLESFTRWAGRRSVLIAFAYGMREHVTHVIPPSMRVLGPDVRTLFRDVVAWDVLGAPMYVYPRWLAEVSRGKFSAHVTP